MFNIVISLYRVSLPRQQRPLQTCKTATATHSALKRTYRTLYSQNRKMHSPNISPHSMRKVSCVCHFFHTSTNATSLFDSKRRYFAIAQYASLLRYFAIAQYASLLRYWLCQYAPLGWAIAGRRYAPLRRYFAIAQYASLLRYWLCQYAPLGWAIAGRRYAQLARLCARRWWRLARIRRALPSVYCPVHNLAEKTTNPAQRAGFQNKKKRRNPHNARGSQIKKNDETRPTGGFFQRSTT